MSIRLSSYLTSSTTRVCCPRSPRHRQRARPLARSSRNEALSGVPGTRGDEPQALEGASVQCHKLDAPVQRRRAGLRRVDERRPKRASPPGCPPRTDPRHHHLIGSHRIPPGQSRRTRSTPDLAGIRRRNPAEAVAIPLCAPPHRSAMGVPFEPRDKSSARGTWRRSTRRRRRSPHRPTQPLPRHRIATRNALHRKRAPETPGCTALRCPVWSPMHRRSSRSRRNARSRRLRAHWRTKRGRWGQELLRVTTRAREGAQHASADQ